ncbi:hypothetical protein [Spongorhabdus nitratireducens]
MLMIQVYLRSDDTNPAGVMVAYFVGLHQEYSLIDDLMISRHGYGDSAQYAVVCSVMPGGQNRDPQLISKLQVLGLRSISVSLTSLKERIPADRNCFHFDSNAPNASDIIQYILLGLAELDPTIEKDTVFAAAERILEQPFCFSAQYLAAMTILQSLGNDPWHSGAIDKLPISINMKAYLYRLPSPVFEKVI